MDSCDDGGVWIRGKDREERGNSMMFSALGAQIAHHSRHTASAFKLALTAVLLVALLPLRAEALPAGGTQTGVGWIESQAAGWHTWVLTSGSQFRPGPPPDEATTQAELEQLQAVADQRDTTALDQIEFWDTGAPSYRWNELSVSEALKHNLGANYATRALALVHVALSDAMVATWDAKYAY